MEDPLQVEVWSDIVCPWCAIGRVRLRKAIAKQGLEVPIVHRAFELDPERAGSRPTLEFLAERYGSEESAREMTARVRELAAAEGMVLHTDEAIAANTFDAHRLLLWAQGKGRGEACMDLLVEAHFTGLLDVSDRAVLVDVASRCGLDGDQAKGMLEGHTFAADVRADEEAARLLGVRGVPFFVIGGRVGLSGAQPLEVFARALAMQMHDQADAGPGKPD